MFSLILPQKQRAWLALHREDMGLESNFWEWEWLALNHLQVEPTPWWPVAGCIWDMVWECAYIRDRVFSVIGSSDQRKQESSDYAREGQQTGPIDRRRVRWREEYIAQGKARDGSLCSVCGHHGYNILIYLLDDYSFAFLLVIFYFIFYWIIADL